MRKITATFIIWGVLFVHGGASREYASANAWVDGTHFFHEETRFLAQVLGDGDRVARAPLLAGVLAPPAYRAGDDEEFYAINMQDRDQYLLEASLHAVSDRAYIFVENGRQVVAGRIESLLASFDATHDAVVEQFGPPPDSVDSDPRIYLLILDIIDRAQADGARVLGYFSSINQYRNAQLARWTDQRSNEVEMLYIDHVSLNLGADGAEAVAAHEFTHLVQWARDPQESVWVNEGAAVYIEAILGYDVNTRISAFQKEPHTPLLDWSDSIADYGAAYLFFAYVSEQFGGTPAIAAIVKNRERSTRGIERALAAPGKSVSFDKLFSDWVVANYLDDPDLKDGAYGYATLDVSLGPSIVEAQYPIVDRISKVKPWTALYTEFEKEQEDALSVTVHDNNGDDVVAQIIEIGEETTVSPVKSREAESGTVELTDNSKKVVLVVTSQPDPPEKEVDSSYTYSVDIQETVASTDSAAERKITTWGSIKRN